MTVTIELSEEEGTKLQAKAARAGLTPADYLRSVIDDDAAVTAAFPKTGTDLVAAIDALNLSGTFGDTAIDSPELARLLRKRAETRSA